MLIVVAALVVALSMELRGSDSEQSATSGIGSQGVARDHRDADTAEALAEPRAKAKLEPCPPAGLGDGPQALRGITLACAGDGTPVDVASSLAGRATVLNLWAYWCGPCADELPAMAEYQRREGDPRHRAHRASGRERGGRFVPRLAELGVRLPTLQDGRRLIAAALRVPNVMPATVVLRWDGTVAEVLPAPFATADEIAAAVNPGIT